MVSAEKDFENVSRTELNVPESDGSPSNLNRKISGLPRRSEDDQSSTSGSGRALLLARKQREQIVGRLNSPVRSFLKKTLAFALFFILLMGPATILSLIGIHQSDSGLKRLSTTLFGRLDIQRFIINVRKMKLYTALNRTEEVTKAYSRLKTTYDRWLTVCIPMYLQGNGMVEKMKVSTWSDGVYTIEELTALKVVQLTAKHVQFIISNGPGFFARPDAYLSTSVRFLFDNEANMVTYFNFLRQGEIDDLKSSLSMYEALVILCCSIMTLLILIVAVVAPYMAFKSFIERFYTII